MEKIFKTENILCGLKVLISILSFITLVVLLFQLFQIICHCYPQSFEEIITSLSFSKFLLIACFSLFTLYIATKQLQKQADIATITALTELRKLLTSERNRQVHFMLSSEEGKSTFPKDEKSEQKDKKLFPNDVVMIDVYNYLGTIELGVEMVKRGLIDFDAFYTQFGYRIENIFEEEDKEKESLYSIVRKHIYDNKSYYRNLLWGRNRIEEELIKNK